jgi:hypothetical protein
MTVDNQPRKTAIQAALSAGVVAPALFIPLDVLDGLLRPGYSLTRHWVSHLALGPWGWVGTALLAVTAVLVGAGAIGLLLALRHRGRIASAVALLVAAIGLAIAAAFPMDPSLGFPVDSTEGTPSFAGLVHQAAGPVFIVGLAIALLTAPRSLRSIGAPVSASAFRAAGIAVLVAFVLCSVLVSLDYAEVWPAAPSGLAERLAIAIGLVGTAVVEYRVRASMSAPGPLPSGE